MAKFVSMNSLKTSGDLRVAFFTWLKSVDGFSGFGVNSGSWGCCARFAEKQISKISDGDKATAFGSAFEQLKKLDDLLGDIRVEAQKTAPGYKITTRLKCSSGAFKIVVRNLGQTMAHDRCWDDDAAPRPENVVDYLPVERSDIAYDIWGGLEPFMRKLLWRKHRKVLKQKVSAALASSSDRAAKRTIAARKARRAEELESRAKALLSDAKKLRKSA